jgi:hypothetical protein
MTDRELLELAAKAAGYDIKHHVNSTVIRGCYFSLDRKNWNPLTDDGDALRLAVKLNMDVSSDEFNNDSMCIVSKGIGNHSISKICSHYGYGDKYAATRRAIVMAAAEIGRNHDMNKANEPIS